MVDLPPVFRFFPPEILLSNAGSCQCSHVYDHHHRAVWEVLSLDTGAPRTWRVQKELTLVLQHLPSCLWLHRQNPPQSNYKPDGTEHKIKTVHFLFCWDSDAQKQFLLMLDEPLFFSLWRCCVENWCYHIVNRSLIPITTGFRISHFLLIPLI